jgi:hypothetical protein
MAARRRWIMRLLSIDAQGRGKGTAGAVNPRASAGRKAYSNRP